MTRGGAKRHGAQPFTDTHSRSYAYLAPHANIPVVTRTLPRLESTSGRARGCSQARTGRVQHRPSAQTPSSTARAPEHLRQPKKDREREREREEEGDGRELPPVLARQTGHERLRGRGPGGSGWVRVRPPCSASRPKDRQRHAPSSARLQSGSASARGEERARRGRSRKRSRSGSASAIAHDNPGDVPKT